MVKQLAWMKGGILARNPGKTKSFWDDPLNSRSSLNKKGHRLFAVAFSKQSYRLGAGLSPAEK
jgi:hypothetical protein